MDRPIAIRADRPVSASILATVLTAGLALLAGLPLAASPTEPTDAGPAHVSIALGADHVVDNALGTTRVRVDGGTVPVTVVERIHRDGASGAVTWQYLFFAAPVSPASSSADGLPDGLVLVTATGRLTHPIPAAALLTATPIEPRDPAEPEPVEDDPIQDVIDELEGYKVTLQRIKDRSTGAKKENLCKAIEEIDKAIAKLQELEEAGTPPAGIEGEIEAALRAAAAAIAATNPSEGSTLDRIGDALAYLAANLF